MPHIVVDKVVSALNDDGKAIKGASVLVVGIAYKPDIDDVRETPAAEIIEDLCKGAAQMCNTTTHMLLTFPEMRAHDIDLILSCHLLKAEVHF